MLAINYYSFLLNVMVSGVADCPTSRRSGRHIIPPLAWWTTQRVHIDPYTNCTKIVCDSPVVKAETLTDKFSCSFASKASNICTGGLQKNECPGIHVKQEVLSELSTSMMEKGTHPLVTII